MSSLSYQDLVKRAVRTHRGSDWEDVFDLIRREGLDAEEIAFLFNTVKEIDLGPRDARWVLECFVYLYETDGISSAGKKYAEVQNWLCTLKGKSPHVDALVEHVEDWPASTYVEPVEETTAPTLDDIDQ